MKATLEFTLPEEAIDPTEQGLIQSYLNTKYNIY